MMRSLSQLMVQTAFTGFQPPHMLNVDGFFRIIQNGKPGPGGLGFLMVPRWRCLGWGFQAFSKKFFMRTMKSTRLLSPAVLAACLMR